MSSTYLGIDPGKKGALVVITQDGIIIDMTLMPQIGNAYDLQEILAFTKRHDPIHAVIEDVHAIQGGGATSNFQFGMGCGFLEMGLAALEIPYTKASPRRWQTTMWAGITRQTKPKDTSLLAAKRLFPNETFIPQGKRVVQDGLVDAALMAEYSRRLFFKQNYDGA